MEIRPRAIPGAGARAVAVREVRGRPGDRLVTLSVDAPSVARGPIRRGDGPPYVAVDGRRVTAAAEQRRVVLPVVGPDGHLARFTTARPDRRAVAVTGCGNLGMNPGVVARTDSGHYGIPGPAAGALAVHARGRAVRSSPQAEAPGGGFLITGPDLVRGGAAVPPDSAAFADPRHLLLFPYVEVRPGVRVDLGHDRLLADAAAYAAAVAGRPVRLPLAAAIPDDDRVATRLQRLPVPEAAVRAALATKGYAESRTPDAPGTWRFAGGDLEIVFLPGIYPHHVLAAGASGAPRSVLVSGASNRAGVRIAELAEDLARQDVADAVLLDNGGDVGLLLPESGRFAIEPAEPDRHRQWPLTACLIWHEPAVRRVDRHARLSAPR